MMLNIADFNVKCKKFVAWADSLLKRTNYRVIVIFNRDYFLFFDFDLVFQRSDEMSRRANLTHHVDGHGVQRGWERPCVHVVEVLLIEVLNVDFKLLQHKAHSLPTTLLNQLYLQLMQ